MRRRPDYLLHDNQFARMFRNLRVDAGLTLATVACEMNWSIVYLSHIERGRRAPPKAADIDRMLRAVGRPDMIDEMRALAVTATGILLISLHGQRPDVVAMLVAVQQAAGKGRLTPGIARKIMRILGVSGVVKHER